MTLVSLHPVFTVNDEERAAELVKVCQEKTKTEEGCVYYEFFRSGDKLGVREGYVDGAAVVRHLENVGETLGKMLEGPLTLDRIEIFGPEEELQVVKPAVESLGATFYVMSVGFANFDAAKK